MQRLSAATLENESKAEGAIRDEAEEAKYGGDSEAAAAARSSARARAATLGDSTACEAEVTWGTWSGDVEMRCVDACRLFAVPLIRTDPIYWW